MPNTIKLLHGITIFILVISLVFTMSSFNIVDTDLQKVRDQNVIQTKRIKELSEDLDKLTERTDKILQVLQVYRNGINQLKVEMDEGFNMNSDTIDSIMERLEERESYIESLESATGGYGVLTGRQAVGGYEELIEEENFMREKEEEKEEVKEEDFQTSELDSVGERVDSPTPELPLESSPMVDNTCPKVNRDVHLGDYINKISFYRAVKIVVGYDILEGEIVNVRVVEGSTRNSRLMKAIATYLEDASFITDKRSVKGCTLPIRIEV